MRNFQATPPPRRPGFTLIELLVVIAIIGVLVTLATLAAFRVMGSQEEKMSRTTVQKIDVAMQQQWGAAVDEAKDNWRQNEIPDAAVKNLLAVSGQQRNRAFVIYQKLKLRAEFPESFAEVLAMANDPMLTPYFPAFGVVARDSYLRLVTGATADTPENEAAALLYAAVTTNRRGTGFDPEDALGAGGVATMTIGGKQMKVFVDGWGVPITFKRWLNPIPEHQAELDTIATNQGKPVDKLDPQDPEGFLTNWTGGDPIAPALVGHSLLVPTHNWQPYVMSAGPDQMWNTGDEILSYALDD